MFVSRLVEAEVSEAQLGAWLMATYVHGLSVQVGEEPRNITGDTGQHSGDGVPHPGHGRQRREPGVARLLPQPRGGQAQHRRGRGQGDSIQRYNLTLSTMLRPGVPRAGPRPRRVRAEGADDLRARAGHHGRHAGQAREHPRLQGPALSRSVGGNCNCTNTSDVLFCRGDSRHRGGCGLLYRGSDQHPVSCRQVRRHYI